jgi:hypothetical protein
MIHVVTSATIRALRTRFPRLKALLAREGEIVITDRGRPAYLLRIYNEPPRARVAPVNYFDRLKARQPTPLSRAASRALDTTDRGER